MTIFGAAYLCRLRGGGARQHLHQPLLGCSFQGHDSRDDEGRDGNEIVRLDILTVRQWPTTKNDLNFEVVIAACPLCVAVCPSLPEVVHSDTAIIALPANVMAKIPFFRVWCLYETFYAAHFNK